MAMGFESTSFNSEYEGLFYSRNIELTVSLRDVDHEYYIHRSRSLVNYSNVVDQYVTVYWKPPGALMWVEKFTTERLSGNNLDFVTKGYFDTEDQDLSTMQLKCDVFGRNGDRWSSIETSLGRIVNGGVYGAQLTLALDLVGVPKELEFKQSEILPGFLHLRTEFVNSLAKDTCGFKIVIAPEERGTRRPLWSKYSSELYKVNVANRLDNLPNPYLILNRDCGELESHRYFYANESRITNGDWDRVMKIVLSKRSNGKKKGFVLFTVNDLIMKHHHCPGNEQLLSIHGADHGRLLREMMVAVSLHQFGHFKTFHDYMMLGLKIIRVYAVDYTHSNRNTSKHGNPFRNSDSDFSAYEEALGKVANTMAQVCDGESVFYSFGDDGTDLVTTFSDCNHMQTLIRIFRDELCSFMFKNMKLSVDADEERRINEDYGMQPSYNNSSYTTYRPQSQPGTSRTLYSCMPQSCKPQGHCLTPRKLVKRLTPVLEELYALLLTRPSGSLEYFTAFIFTDGGFSDLEKATEMMEQLSTKPISLIFIGIGNGDLSHLQRLNSMSSFRSRGFRHNSHVIHFRSGHQWQSALSYYKIKSKPDEVFRKEILTAVRDQSVAYLRLKHP